METTKLIREFIASQGRMVVSTIGDGKPEAALVGFASADNLSLVFGTSTASRKFKNIQNNANVAIVISNNDKITVQYEGIASVLEDDELIKYKDLYFQKKPGAQKYETDPTQTYLKVKPTWVRYVDYNKRSEQVFELTF